MRKSDEIKMGIPYSYLLESEEEHEEEVEQEEEESEEEVESEEESEMEEIGSDEGEEEPAEDDIFMKVKQYIDQKTKEFDSQKKKLDAQLGQIEAEREAARKEKERMELEKEKGELESQRKELESEKAKLKNFGKSFIDKLDLPSGKKFYDKSKDIVYYEEKGSWKQIQNASHDEPEKSSDVTDTEILGHLKAKSSKS